MTPLNKNSWLIGAQACRLLRDVAACGDPTGGNAEEAPLVPRGKRNARSGNQPPLISLNANLYFNLYKKDGCSIKILVL